MKLNRKWLVIPLVLLSIGVGFAIGEVIQTYPFSPLVSQQQITVAGNIGVTDVATGATLSLKYMGTESTVFPPLQVTEFPKGPYPNSFWGFIENFPGGADMMAYMKVIGPGDDGVTFRVEISRMTWNELKVSTPTGQFDFPAITANGVISQGYLTFEFVPTFS
jgi:hypothetical protein